MALVSDSPTYKKLISSYATIWYKSNPFKVLVIEYLAICCKSNFILSVDGGGVYTKLGPPYALSRFIENYFADPILKYLLLSSSFTNILWRPF